MFERFWAPLKLEKKIKKLQKGDELNKSELKYLIKYRVLLLFKILEEFLEVMRENNKKDTHSVKVVLELSKLQSYLKKLLLDLQHNLLNEDKGTHDADLITVYTASQLKNDQRGNEREMRGLISNFEEFKSVLKDKSNSENVLLMIKKVHIIIQREYRLILETLQYSRKVNLRFKTPWRFVEIYRRLALVAFLAVIASVAPVNAQDSGTSRNLNSQGSVLNHRSVEFNQSKVRFNNKIKEVNQLIKDSNNLLNKRNQLSQEYSVKYGGNYNSSMENQLNVLDDEISVLNSKINKEKKELNMLRNRLNTSLDSLNVDIGRREGKSVTYNSNSENAKKLARNVIQQKLRDGKLKKGTEGGEDYYYKTVNVFGKNVAVYMWAKNYYINVIESGSVDFKNLFYSFKKEMKKAPPGSKKLISALRTHVSKYDLNNTKQRKTAVEDVLGFLVKNLNYSYDQNQNNNSDFTNYSEGLKTWELNKSFLLMFIDGSGDCDDFSFAGAHLLNKIGIRTNLVLFKGHAAIGVEFSEVPVGVAPEFYKSVGNKFIVFFEPQTGKIFKTKNHLEGIVSPEGKHTKF